nr:uncharacterized protein LOC123748274 [Procambarus clarkii]
MEVTRDEKTIEICYRDKDADTLYEMFHTRALLHKKAYQHHTVKVIEQMLIDAFMKADGILSTYQDKNGLVLRFSSLETQKIRCLCNLWLLSHSDLHKFSYEFRDTKISQFYLCCALDIMSWNLQLLTPVLVSTGHSDGSS